MISKINLNAQCAHDSYMSINLDTVKLEIQTPILQLFPDLS